MIAIWLQMESTSRKTHSINKFVTLQPLYTFLLQKRNWKKNLRKNHCKDVTWNDTFFFHFRICKRFFIPVLKLHIYMEFCNYVAQMWHTKEKCATHRASYNVMHYTAIFIHFALLLCTWFVFFFFAQWIFIFTEKKFQTITVINSMSTPEASKVL